MQDHDAAQSDRSASSDNVSTPEAAHARNSESLDQTLRRIEARLLRLEQYLSFPPLPDEKISDQVVTERAAPPAPTATETGLEMAIGEFWLARVGVLALIVGLAFLVTYPFATLPSLVPCLIGFAAVAGLFALSRHWRDSLQHLSGIMFGGALFLLYFATLRLHFFSVHPFIASRALGLALLVGVLAVQFYVAARRQSELIAGLVVVLCFTTSLISDTTNFALTLMVATAATVVWLLRKFDWQLLTNLTVALTYLTHLLWLLNNPLLGHPIRAVADPGANLLFLGAYAALFAAANCFHYQQPATIPARILRTIMNGGGVLIIGNLNALAFSPARLLLINLVIGTGFLGTAILYWLHRRSRYSTSIYACFGYLAMSAAIFARFPSPAYFTWLAWQSLLVVSTAVWFSSKIVIVANLFIYTGLYLAYLVAAPAVGSVSLSFAVVALVTARILNWQKHRLDLHTELLRNIYLGAAGVIIPYGLYYTVPKAWVSVSWLAAAVGYFAISLLLRNRKYRWLAILTILAAAAYAFFVDLNRLDPVYRIISFLVLGIVLLVVSIFYTRHRRTGRAEP